jgi:hypothetical protein
MSQRKDRAVPWIIRYKDRNLKSRKIRKTEEQIQAAKDSSDWKLVKKLKLLLRNTWWGYKKIKNKS